MAAILTTKFVKWFFYRYFSIPKNKDIFGVGRNFIDYWEDTKKGIAKRRDYGQALSRINPFVIFLSKSERGGTDTFSTNNKDTFLYAPSPDNNYGSQNNLRAVRDDPYWDQSHSIIHWTLSSGSGIITAVKLYLYKYADVGGYTCPAVEVHELTQTGWTEVGATWNKYDGGNAWTTPGGDFSATIVDVTNSPLSQGNYGWEDWDLGPGATNPISGLTWGSQVHLLLRYPLASVLSYVQWYSKEGTHVPYIEITYTPAAAGISQGFIF